MKGLLLLSLFLIPHISHGEEEIIMMEIERQTLGSYPVLGQLYSAHSDQLLHGFSFWYNEDIEKDKVSIYHPWQETHIQRERSVEDDMTLLNVDAQLEASFKAGMVKVRGSAKYLDIDETYQEFSAVTFTYQSRSRTEAISPKLTQNRPIDVCDQNNPVYKLSQKYTPTHVVSAITYGGDVHFVYKQEVEDNKDLLDVFGSLSVEIDVKMTNIKGEASLNFTDNEKDSKYKLKIEMFSDFIVDVQPTTFDDTLKIYKSISSNFGSRENMYEWSVPMSMELIPIVAFCPEGGLAAEISESILKMATDIRITLKTVLRDIDKLMESVAGRKNFKVRQLLLDFKSRVSKYTLNYEANLQKYIVDGRNPNSANQINETAIVGLVDEYKNSKFDYETYLYPYLTERRRQVNAINIFYDGTLNQNQPQIADYGNADIPRAIITRPILFLLTLNILPNFDAEKYETFNGTISKCMWYNDKMMVGEVGQLWRDYLNFFGYNNFQDGFEFFIQTSEDSCGLTPMSRSSTNTNFSLTDVVDISLYENGIELDIDKDEFKKLVQKAPAVSVCRKNIGDTSLVTIKIEAPAFNHFTSLEIEEFVIEYWESTSDSGIMIPPVVKQIRKSVDEVCGKDFFGCVSEKCEIKITELQQEYSYSFTIAYASKYGSGKPSQIIKMDGDVDQMMNNPGCIIENNIKLNKLKPRNTVQSKSSALECAQGSQGYWSYEIGAKLCYDIDDNTTTTTTTTEGWITGTKSCMDSKVESRGSICKGKCPACNKPLKANRDCETYQGCYYAQNTFNDNKQYGDQYNSVERCIIMCGFQQFKFAYLQGGSGCFCSKSLLPLSDKVENHECNLECSGNKEEICGGVQAPDGGQYYSAFAVPSQKNNYCGCPDGWARMTDGDCFFLNASPLRTQPEARQDCVDKGGDLASVHSAEELLFIENMLEERFNTNVSIWLGGSYKDTQGIWVWTDGSAWDYNNWRSEEPNGDGPCFVNGEGGGWNDVTCSGQKAYMCRKPRTLTAVTETTQSAGTLTAVTETTQSAGCPDGWSRMTDGDCFNLNASPLRTQPEARQDCVDKGGDLASVHSAEELLFIENMLEERFNTNVSIWLGGSYKDTQGTDPGIWVWTDGSAWDYNNWRSEEPNGDGPCFENHEGGGWNDLPCSGQKAFMCRKPSCMATGQCFFVNTNKTTFAQAEVDCQNRGAHLASIHSDTEMSFVQDILLKISGERFWLGGSDSQNEKTWRWTDGTLFDFGKWRTGEPNGGTSENCVFHHATDDAWYDVRCDYLAYSVCLKGSRTTVAETTKSAGCYSHGNKVGWYKQYDDTSNSKDRCLATCSIQNYKYAGTEDGSECYCGNELPSGLLATEECNMQCDNGDRCGGYNKLWVYSPC